MNDYVRTGIAGLDGILLGGIPRRNNILVEGPPGAGKTTMGLGYIYYGVLHHAEPGVIVSFELDAAKLQRDAAGFNWDLQVLIDAGKIRIIQTSPAVFLSEFRSPDGAFSALLQQLGAKRLLIDGLTPMRLYAQMHDRPFREDVHLLIEGLTRLGVTTMVTAEHDEANCGIFPHERFVFDTIISLTRHDKGGKAKRRLAVLKSRGHDYLSGNHTFRIERNQGIHVYPRAGSRRPQAVEKQDGDRRISIGSNALDQMMEGGLYRGSITMITGISGTGKTVLGLQFLCAAAATGHKCLLVTLDESPEQLARKARGLALNIDEWIACGAMFILNESPLELELDVHFQQIVALVEEHNIDCVVFDSVAVYEALHGEEVANYLFSLASYMKSRMATVLFNYESPELLGLSQISKELNASHLVDNIILLNYVEISTTLRRAIAVPKVRGSRHRQVTREYVIDAGGILLVDEAAASTEEGAVPQLPFSSYYGLLSRSPTRKSPVIEEALSKGEKLPESVDLPVEPSS